METGEKNLTHDESFELIQSMISMAKNNVTDDGFHFLLWGVLTILASMCQFILLRINFANNGLPWMLMPVIGIPLALIYEWRKKKAEKVRSHYDSIFGYLWLGVGIGIFSVIFISVKSQVSPIPFVLCLMGIGTLVTGTIVKFKSLIYGGIILFIAAIGSSFADAVTQLLIYALAAFLGYIIPGLLLWKAYKAQQNV